MEARDRIIVALDVPTLARATSVVRRLAGRVGGFKVGLELLTAEGAPAVVKAIHDLGGRVFFDGKFADIPNTISGAVRSVASMGVWMFDVHASAGPAAIAAAAAERGTSILLAVTVLTSLDDAAARAVFGAPARDKVLDFARMAVRLGAGGIVCSPQELPVIRADPALAGVVTVVPGVRPAWASTGDQARVATPTEAVRAGATHLVIGRPILMPPAQVGTPEAAVDRIVAEIVHATSAPPPPSEPPVRPSGTRRVSSPMPRTGT